ncbi:MAG TPA: L,D-transpeptidase, partial [Gaiellaceae bacterium]|nr:L,D-transpeptidase [Gaiellaceae bacterium]
APHHAAPLAIPAALLRHLSAHAACSHLRPAPTRAYAALVLRATTATGGAKLRRWDLNGYRTVLGVLGAHVDAHCRPTLVHVQLPGPPNGRAGWIKAQTVRVFPIADRIVVDLSARLLVAYRHGRPQLHARVAVGAPRMPTPTGRYVVNERWLLDNPNGVFGVAALGISAHSTVLHNWLQGGPVAIHGTNEPWSIGKPASHGCIRMRNADMRRLLRFAPAGTPVVIHR